MVLGSVPGQRPRNAAATRQAILQSASLRFCADGYDQVGMRDIARDVGVDPALISRYFGSKEDLFSAVLETCGDTPELLDGDRSTFGQRIAQDLVYGVKREEKLRLLLIMLRSIGSPKAAEMVNRASNTSFFEPFSAWVGGEDAKIRARLAVGLIMGLAISRDITGGFNLSPEDCRKLSERLAVTLQSLIDD